MSMSLSEHVSQSHTCNGSVVRNALLDMLFSVYVSWHPQMESPHAKVYSMCMGILAACTACMYATACSLQDISLFADIHCPATPSGFLT